MRAMVPRPTSHGLYVKAESGLKLRHRKVRRLVAKMHAEMPWLAPADLPACRAWAELEILGSRAFAELDANGLTNAAGEPRRLLGEFRQLRQAQLAFERELGMTPAARMGLRVGDSRARSTDVLTALAKQAGEEPAARPRRQVGRGVRHGSRISEATPLVGEAGGSIPPDDAPPETRSP